MSHGVFSSGMRQLSFATVCRLIRAPRLAIWAHCRSTQSFPSRPFRPFFPAVGERMEARNFECVARPMCWQPFCSMASPTCEDMQPLLAAWLAGWLAKKAPKLPEAVQGVSRVRSLAFSARCRSGSSRTCSYLPPCLVRPSMRRRLRSAPHILSRARLLQGLHE